MWGIVRMYLNLRHLSVKLQRESVRELQELAEIAGGIQNQPVSLSSRQKQYALYREGQKVGAHNW